MSSCLATLALCASFVVAQQDNPTNFISGATLFTGPAADIVDVGYARYQGKQDANTNTSNYLGKMLHYRTISDAGLKDGQQD